MYMGYWPSVRSRWLDIGQGFFSSQYKKRKKKERGQCPASWPNKLGQERVYYMTKGLHQDFGNKAGNPEQARWAHLARSGSQSEHRIRFILPARGASRILRLYTGRKVTPLVGNLLRYHVNKQPLTVWSARSSSIYLNEQQTAYD